MFYKVGTQFKFKKIQFVQYSTKRVNSRTVAVKIK